MPFFRSVIPCYTSETVKNGLIQIKPLDFLRLSIFQVTSLTNPGQTLTLIIATTIVHGYGYEAPSGYFVLNPSVTVSFMEFIQVLFKTSIISG